MLELTYNIYLHHLKFCRFWTNMQIKPDLINIHFKIFSQETTLPIYILNYSLPCSSIKSPCSSVRQSVHPFTLSLKMSQLLLEEMILYLINDFGIVTCTVSTLCRLTAHLLPVYRAVHVCHNENFRNRYLSFYWKK